MLQSIIYRLRIYRRLHKVIGLSLAVFIIISSLTGILLGWKKNAALLQPPTKQGSSVQLSTWMSLDELARIAQRALDSATQSTANKIDRMEARPKNGIVKVLFSKGYWEVQVDGTSGKVLSVQQRHSDWIEHLHDGSIINDGFKLVSMNILGLGLLAMTFTGFWLWFGPRKIRKAKM
jgi:uncharacterized iron-regulated membrane protein